VGLGPRAPGERRLVVVSGDVFTPGSLGAIQYTDEGELGPLVSGNGGIQVPGPVRTWSLPDGHRVVDALGNVYAVPALEYQ
jgi:hypothetical protein